jgi:uncharacterized protein (DUF433 family)
MTIDLLDRAIYTYADVDRLVGLKFGTARRWLEGYLRAQRRYEPVLREQATGSESVTWGELVEARLLAEFRNQRVPIQRMRPAIVRLRQEFGRYPLAQARPFLEAEGRELVRVVQDEVGLDRSLQLVVVRSNQLMLAAATERFSSAVDFDSQGVALLLRPEARTPDVVMDPTRTFGQPAIRSVRTETIAEAYRTGSSRDELAELFELSPEQVDSAIRFELIAGGERAA